MTPPALPGPLAPFTYPSEPHVRRHGPRGYASYYEYKDWLRDEFVFRCVYCLEREMWYPNAHAGFGVDHFEPKALRPEGALDYENLVYACSRCNSYKQAAIVYLDPTAESFADHFSVSDDGQVIGSSKEARRLVKLLDLNNEHSVSCRRRILHILALRTERPDDSRVRDLFLLTFGFPPDLPDLRAKKPPGGNSCEGSAETCFFALRAAGKLPAVY